MVLITAQRHLAPFSFIPRQGCGPRRGARPAQLESPERTGQRADQRPQDALTEWLLQIDVLEAAPPRAQLGEPIGHRVRLAASDQLAEEHKRQTQNADAAE